MSVGIDNFTASDW